MVDEGNLWNLVLQQGLKKDSARVPLSDEGAQHLNESMALVVR